MAGTEACASVTSAFLQVLATLADVEASRTDKPRNILHILSTNTRRTKVVELSSGTHRWVDGEGGGWRGWVERGGARWLANTRVRVGVYADGSRE